MTIWLSSLHSVERRGVAQHLFEDSRVLDRCGRELGVLCPSAGGYFSSNMSMFVKSGHLMVCAWVLFWTGLWFATDFSRGTLHFFEQCPILVWIWSRCMGSRRATLARLWLSGFWRRTGVPLGWLPNRSDPAFWASGDAVDKGAGDIRVVKMLLALKRRYWSRATWVWRWLRSWWLRG